MLILIVGCVALAAVLALVLFSAPLGDPETGVGRRDPLPRGQMTAPNAPPVPTSTRRPTAPPPVEPHRTVTLRIVHVHEGQPTPVVEGEDY